MAIEIGNFQIPEKFAHVHKKIYLRIFTLGLCHSEKVATIWMSLVGRMDEEFMASYPHRAVLL